MTDPREEIISAYTATAALPDDTGHFPTDDALFGGRFMPEALMAVLKEVTEAYEVSKTDPAFHREFADLLLHYANRPSLLTAAHNLSRQAGARILLKREDLNHTGSHKINNVLGQALLAKRMGKTRVIAETGAGQHGVATATAAALLDLDCV
ncbi:MAG: pyridoxal-phosphate dependent enzyme, partial [Catenulispora sp.]